MSQRFPLTLHDGVFLEGRIAILPSKCKHKLACAQHINNLRSSRAFQREFLWMSRAAMTLLSDLSREELTRYSQQIKLKNVGVNGQLRLRNAKVLCVGAGGLASPVLSYLSSAGIGILGIVDDDEVELENLHRQLLFRRRHVGMKK